MDRDQVISVLKAHEDELRAAGVVSVSLFGSVARGHRGLHDVDAASQDLDAHSRDIDVAVRLAENFSKPGLDYIGRLEDLERRLSQLLGCKVDVIEEPVRKNRFQREIDRDRAVAS